LGWSEGDLGRLAPECGQSGQLALFFFCFLFLLFLISVLFFFENAKPI
jgi:hypothetical protein